MKKTYKIITYSTVFEECFVEAEDEMEARENFYADEITDRKEIDACDTEIDSIKCMEDEPPDDSGDDMRVISIERVTV